jgi:CBS domain containing-hemolysin-like protein
MVELILVVTGLLAVSFLCSILESVILSITRPYIEMMIHRGKGSGKTLKKMKSNIDEPISAILTLNTISHTVGAALSGALAIKIFGESWMGVFSAVLTFLILIFSEIIPKTLGATYWKKLSGPSAVILRVIIILLKPIIVPVNLLSSLLAGGAESKDISKEEILTFARLGYYQGSIRPSEYAIIDNLFHMQEIRVSSIMTPRTVVNWLPHKGTVDSALSKKDELPFSRYPLYDPDTNKVHGIVLRRDIMTLATKKKVTTPLKKIAMKAEMIPESTTVYRLLNMISESRNHMYIVLNEYGDYTGIVTLEDCIETLLGREIMDEFDAVPDMQRLARLRGMIHEED